MKNNQLCEALLRADSEEAVITHLCEAGYWDRPEVWRHYGDVENNWGQSGNQQSLAEAALAEKIVNSVDARLIDMCWERGTDPKSPDAPPSVRAAISRFFDGVREGMSTGGIVEDWSETKTRRVAEQITLCVTGIRPTDMNITISDCGEGQTASRLPTTILSLNKSNKMYVPFVQGQFNQGGTGALRFCGKENLQLVISRRNPALVDMEPEKRGHEWCFTIIRRERPSGGRRNSIYTYLAPVGIDEDSEPRRGDVLTFPAETFGIFPNDVGPYGRQAQYGTAIKMYDYKFIGERSNILRGRSLLSRLDLLLPELALPIRLYEYRKNTSGAYLDVGSRRTTVLGLLRRIKNSDNVEKGFPVSVPIQPNGEKLIAHIFAFVAEGTSAAGGKGGKGTRRLGGARSYRKREGVLFIRNGQTQGGLSKDFFRRDAVKMKPLADDLLVFVECDGLSDYVREDLFMASRDRLADNDFRQSMLDAMEKMLRDCEELKELRNRRQRERMNARLRDEKPLADVLQSLIKSSPNLVTLLQLGQRISAPYNTRSTGVDPGSDYRGEVYPTFFKYKRVPYSVPVALSRPINHRIRLTFETDARNDYFTRSAERGLFDAVWLEEDGDNTHATITGPKLRNGIAIVMLELPGDATIGDEVTLVVSVSDSLTEFEVRVVITIEKAKDYLGGGSNNRRSPPSSRNGKDRERPMEVSPPAVTRIYRRDWEAEGFDENTAMRVAHLGYTDDENTEVYEFKVNMDNMPLHSESKQRRLAADQHSLLCEQFLYANVLIGLSLILGRKRKGAASDVDEPTPTIEDEIERTCQSLAPFVPALVSLGSGDLEFEDHVDGLEETG